MRSKQLGRVESWMARLLCRRAEVGVPLQSLEKPVRHLPFILVVFRFQNVFKIIR